MSYLTEVQKLSKAIGMRRMFVKEWGREVYFTTTTPAEAGKALQLRGNDKSQAEAWAAQVCIKALDEDGKRLFTNDDYDGLKNTQFSHVFGLLVDEMDKVTPVDEVVDSFTKTRG